jgi:phage recombination protein Bet
MSNTALTTNTAKAGLIIPGEWQSALDSVRAMCAPDASENDFKVFCYHAAKAGLDPLAKQIYLVTRNAKMPDGSYGKKATIQVSIDGMRLVAHRSGVYAGQTEPQWCDVDGVWLNVWLKTTPPAAARVGVLRRDFSEPCYGVARFEAYAQRTQAGGYMGLWGKLHDVMLSKCAEMLALRKAFPQELSGLYGKEEMDQADTPEAAPETPRREQAAALLEGTRQRQQAPKVSKPAPVVIDVTESVVAPEAKSARAQAPVPVPVLVEQPEPADEGGPGPQAPQARVEVTEEKKGLALAFDLNVKISKAANLNALAKLGQEIQKHSTEVKDGVREAYMARKTILEKAAGEAAKNV